MGLGGIAWLGNNEYSLYDNTMCMYPLHCVASFLKTCLPFNSTAAEQISEFERLLRLEKNYSVYKVCGKIGNRPGLLSGMLEATYMRNCAHFVMSKFLALSDLTVCTFYTIFQSH